MKKTKTFKALDRSQMDSLVTRWAKTLPTSTKILRKDEDTVMGPVQVNTAKGLKKRQMPMLRLKVAYEY